MKTSFHINKPFYTTLLVIMVVFLSMESCMKDQEDSTILEKIDLSLHPFLFDKGSYWIYTMHPLIADTVKTEPKDSLTTPKDSIIYVPDSKTVRDSIYVESIEKDTLYLKGNVRFYEYYRIKYHSTYGNLDYEDHLIGYVISRGFNDGGFILLSSKKKGDKSLNAEIVDVMDEMKVEEKFYKKVVKMKILKDQYINDDYFMYFADHVGLIRKEKVVNNTIRETWNLSLHKVIMLTP